MDEYLLHLSTENPNQNSEKTLCYMGGCLFEETNISEGRGSSKPFQMYGAPFIDMD